MTNFSIHRSHQIRSHIALKVRVMDLFHKVIVLVIIQINLYMLPIFHNSTGKDNQMEEQRDIRCLKGLRIRVHSLLNPQIQTTETS
jgi:hypothetical protein